MNNFLPKDKFIKSCKQLKLLHDSAHQAYKMKIDIIDYLDDFYSVINNSFEHIYGEQNWALITDWVYGSWDGKIYGRDKNEVLEDIKTEEMLWQFLEKRKND